LAAALGVANAAYGHPRAVQLAARLADPATRVVVTGQQTGLLGGPLLGYVKAAAAVRYAEALSARGEPAVAVFWMATEDHDWAEVASAVVPSPDGPLALALGDDPQPLAPVGLRTVGAGVAPLLAALAARYPQPWSAAELARLAGWWRPEARFGEAFARQMVGVFGDRAPLLLDALLPELKRAEAPHLRRLVEARREFGDALARREAEIVRRGYRLQIPPQPSASPLFVLRGGERRRVEWRSDDRFARRGAAGSEPIATLLATLADNPAVVSPGALARPAIQDAVLGTYLQVMGPAELAYLAQGGAAYDVLGAPPPWTALRPQALLLGRRDRARLAALDVGLGELLSDAAAVERRLGERAGGGFVAPAQAEIAARLAALAAPASALDPALARAHAKTARTVERALERFARKTAAAAARRDGATRERFERLLAAVRPGGKPQERVLSAAHFLLRHGERFGAALLDGVATDPRRLSVIDPGGEDDGAAAAPREAAR
ncbi:MAG: bacillithiol biosynthesis BshC, partial [Thermoanaerobaculia bacterium]|nr:bacillithiol biosynthesis BshC [Thermoanaerobaculia bacterium]